MDRRRKGASGPQLALGVQGQVPWVPIRRARRADAARPRGKKGPGRPRNLQRVAHVSRGVHPRHPLHVTLRVRPEVWNLRSGRSWKVLRRAFYACLPRKESRVAHYSIQGNHIHLLVEAEDGAQLGNMMQIFAIRVARGMNRLMGRRRGTVFTDRYHARSLTCPTETRLALLYVIQNAKKHGTPGGQPRSPHWIDADFSSALYFAGWQEPVGPPREPPPVKPAETWLLDRGWLLAGGPISRAESPRS